MSVLNSATKSKMHPADCKPPKHMQTAELAQYRSEWNSQPENLGNMFISDKPIRTLNELQTPKQDTTKNR